MADLSLKKKVKSRRFIQSMLIIGLASVFLALDFLDGYHWVTAVGIAMGIFTYSDIKRQGA